MTTAGTGGAKTIVLIHGLWMTPLCWEGWVERYTARGYKVLAPAWPGADRPVEEIRRDPSPLAKLGVAEITAHYESIIRGLDEPPLIMGHSFGGLITQILIGNGLGAAGVGIDPAPPKGIKLLPFSALKAASPALMNPLNYGKVKGLTPAQFHYAFGNLLSKEESQAVYERLAIPGPTKPLFQAALAAFAPHSPVQVNVHNETRAPLLLIAGGKDHTVPAAVTRKNLGLYVHSKAVTDFKEYPERSHYTLGQDGWEEVADYALHWAAIHTGAAAT